MGYQDIVAQDRAKYTRIANADANTPAGMIRRGWNMDGTPRYVSKTTPTLGTTPITPVAPVSSTTPAPIAPASELSPNDSKGYADVMRAGGSSQSQIDAGEQHFQKFKSDFESFKSGGNKTEAEMMAFKDQWKSKNKNPFAATAGASSTPSPASPAPAVTTQSPNVTTASLTPSTPSTPSTTFRQRPDGTYTNDGYAAGGKITPQTTASTKPPLPLGKPQVPVSVAGIRGRGEELGYAKGGTVRPPSDGVIPGKVDPTVADDVTIDAKIGEYILSPEVTQALGGAERLDKIVLEIKKQLGIPAVVGPKRHDQPDSLGRMDKPGLGGKVGMSNGGPGVSGSTSQFFDYDNLTPEEQDKAFREVTGKALKSIAGGGTIKLIRSAPEIVTRVAPNLPALTQGVMSKSSNLPVKRVDMAIDTLYEPATRTILQPLGRGGFKQIGYNAPQVADAVASKPVSMWNKFLAATGATGLGLGTASTGLLFKNEQPQQAPTAQQQTPPTHQPGDSAKLLQEAKNTPPPPPAPPAPTGYGRVTTSPEQIEQDRIRGLEEQARVEQQRLAGVAASDKIQAALDDQAKQKQIAENNDRTKALWDEYNNIQSLLKNNVGVANEYDRSFVGAADPSNPSYRNTMAVLGVKADQRKNLETQAANLGAMLGINQKTTGDYLTNEAATLGHRLGLQGHQYIADKGLQGHQAQAGATVEAARLGADGKTNATIASNQKKAQEDKIKKVEEILKNSHGVAPTDEAVKRYMQHENEKAVWDKRAEQDAQSIAKIQPEIAKTYLPMVKAYHSEPDPTKKQKLKKNIDDYLRSFNGQNASVFTRMLEIPSFQKTGLSEWKVKNTDINGV